MKTKSLFICTVAIITTLFLYGCNPAPSSVSLAAPSLNTPPVATPPAAVAVASVSTVPSFLESEYTAYVQKDDYVLSLYEPSEGCYLGAYILANQSISFDMERFDELTQKEHSSFIYNIRLGEEFPTQWLLECIAAQKTPHIVIRPPNSYNPLDESLLLDVAKDFGEYYTPMFVSFYPDPISLSVNAEEYTEFYAKARKLFSSYASNVAFVWTVPARDAYSANSYYPGDDYVDWVGIDVYSAVYQNGTRNTRNIWKDIDFFYNTYQFQKPIMLTALGISHYSTQDHTYYVAQAGETITEIYKKIRSDYPRIKAVYYMDFSGVTLASDRGIQDDYSITGNEALLKAYTDAVSDSYFLEDLSIMDSGTESRQRFKSAYEVYQLHPNYEESPSLFIANNMLVYEMGYGFSTSNSLKATINGEDYYPLNSIAEFLNIQIDVDIEGSKVLLY